ncbi:MAG: peptidylprolyl isomerase [Elusimicrobia bacterium]|nr:peptidylprolyl isomerase [Elusimicrobiota bacterium]
MNRNMFAFALIAVVLSPAYNWAQEKGIRVNGNLIARNLIEQELWRQAGTAVIQQFVDNELIRQESHKLQVQVNPKDIDTRIAKLKEQVGPDFEARLQQAGTNLEALRNQINNSLMIEQLLKKAKQVEVTDKELKDTFDTNKDKLGSPERIRLLQILVTTQQEAGDIIIALKAGADFRKLAQAKSTDQATSQQGGELGLFSKGMLLPDIENVVFTLKAGEFSQAVGTQLGFHVFQVAEKLPSKAAEFKQIKDNLRATLLQQKITQTLPPYIQELRAAAKIEPNL